MSATDTRPVTCPQCSSESVAATTDAFHRLVRSDKYGVELRFEETGDHVVGVRCWDCDWHVGTTDLPGDDLSYRLDDLFPDPLLTADDVLGLAPSIDGCHDWYTVDDPITGETIVEVWVMAEDEARARRNVEAVLSPTSPPSRRVKVVEQERLTNVRFHLHPPQADGLL